jgi:hypothetical protein
MIVPPVKAPVLSFLSPRSFGRRTQVADRQVRQVAKPRAAAVGRDDEIGAELVHPARHPVADATHLLALFDQAGRLGAHQQGEIGIGPRLVGDEIEKIPLRHHRDEAPARVHRREIGHLVALLADEDSEIAHLVVRPLEQTVEESDLGEDAEG